MAATNKNTAGAPEVVDASMALSKIQEHPPLINLGKVKNKKAKKLKKAKGVVPVEISHAYQQIQAGLDGTNHPVIISYQEKPGSRKKRKIKFMGVKIDRKKLKKSMKRRGIRSSFL